jgi:K+-sensing histidine kinase KdpD
VPATLRGQEDLLFDEFMRGQPESPAQGGGLGLAICNWSSSAQGPHLRRQRGRRRGRVHHPAAMPPTATRAGVTHDTANLRVKLKQEPAKPN